MARYIPVSRSALAGKGWRKFASYAFAADSQVVPLLLDEVSRALSTMPIGFIRRAEGRPLELVALLSLRADANLFVDAQGRWRGNYVPARFRGHPFKLLAEEGSNRLVLCFDVDSNLLVEETSGADIEPFFTQEGEMSPMLGKVLQFLEMSSKSAQVTQHAVNALADLNLLVPWTIGVSADGTETSWRLEGLYHVNEAALQALPGLALESLARNGGLALAYAQMFSKVNLANYQRLEAARSRNHPVQLDVEADLDAIFGNNNDSIKFNF